MMSANISLAVLQFVIAAFIVGSFMGFAYRSKQLGKSKKRILELETEMVQNHAEILRLHKVHSRNDNPNESVPVISLKEQVEPGKKTKSQG